MNKYQQQAINSYTREDMSHTYRSEEQAEVNANIRAAKRFIRAVLFAVILFGGVLGASGCNCGTGDTQPCANYVVEFIK